MREAYLIQSSQFGFRKDQWVVARKSFNFIILRSLGIVQRVSCKANMTFLWPHTHTSTVEERRKERFPPFDPFSSSLPAAGLGLGLSLDLFRKIAHWSRFGASYAIISFVLYVERPQAEVGFPFSQEKEREKESRNGMSKGGIFSRGFRYTVKNQRSCVRRKHLSGRSL